MKNMLLYMIIGVLLSVPAMAHEDFEIAEQLINESIPCSQLSEDQLEMIGDYVMEQMHPGEQHEIMDQMMGAEGSESLRQPFDPFAPSFLHVTLLNSDSQEQMSSSFSKSAL